MKDLSSAFHFANLTTLKLIVCTGTSGWLREVIDTKQVVKLKNLEITIEDDIVDLEASLLSDFLSTFSGLEELYVEASPPFSTGNSIDIYSGLPNHSSTLRGLVFHDTDPELDEALEDPDFLDGETSWRGAMQQLLLFSKLKHIGVSKTSAFLVYLVTPKPIVPPTA